MADLKHTCSKFDDEEWKARGCPQHEDCLRCDLTELLKTVATSKRGVMNLGDGSELSRIESALSDWTLIRNEPVVQGRLAVIKLARSQKPAP